MEIKILEKKEDKLTFVVNGINETIVNALRRSLQEVPTLAIDEIEVVKNDSALFDEIIAHRMGLVPLKTEKGLTAKQECTCNNKGCSKCTVALKLKAKGPCTVYTSDIKGKNLIVHKKIPITELIKEQELELSAYARLGTAKEHTKFSPGLVYFRPTVEIALSKECNLCEECVKACPLHLLSLSNKKLLVNNIEKCNLCEACIEACKKQGKEAITVTPAKEEFIFVIESWGQISPKEIFIELIKVIEGNLKEADKKVSKI